MRLWHWYCLFQHNKTNHRPWRASAIWVLSGGGRLQEASPAPRLHIWTVLESLQGAALCVTPSFLQHFAYSLSGCVMSPHAHTQTCLSYWHHLFRNVSSQPVTSLHRNVLLQGRLELVLTRITTHTSWPRFSFQTYLLIKNVISAAGKSWTVMERQKTEKNFLQVSS